MGRVRERRKGNDPLVERLRSLTFAEQVAWADTQLAEASTDDLLKMASKAMRSVNNHGRKF